MNVDSHYTTNNSDVNNLYYDDDFITCYDLDPRSIVKDDIDFYLHHASKLMLKELELMCGSKLKARFYKSITGSEFILNGAKKIFTSKYIAKILKLISLSKSKVNILEIACGSGRVTIPLAKAGYNTWALDLSDKMISKLKNKVTKLPKSTQDRLNISCGNMCDFHIDKNFKLIIIPFRSFQLLTDQKQQNKCLKNIFHHLAEDGIFILNLFKPIKQMEEKWVGENEILDWENDDPEIGIEVRRTHLKTGIDSEKQLATVKINYYINKYKDSEASEFILSDLTTFRYFFRNQILNLLKMNSFKVINEMSYYRLFHFNRTESIFICRKKVSSS
jgi:SAM-dependent methyltransferase